MHIDSATGLLAGTRQVLTPFLDDRPGGVRPDLILIHGISMPPGEFGGPWIDRLFTGNLPPDQHPFFREVAGLRVSSHVLVRRRGELVQYVPFHRRAWHAGVSEYQGRTGCNDFSIGIELEGTDELGYAEAQYESLAALIRSLIATYPSLSTERLAGHSDVAPGRKTDPGPAFSWERLRERLSRPLTPPS